MNKAKIFWDWFKNNNSKYYYLIQITDPFTKEELLDNFLKHLHAYCEGLFFQIGGMPGELQELIISADGNKMYFNEVEKLVSKASEIDGWKIIAFKPAKGFDFITIYEDLEINAQTIWFLPLIKKDNPKLLGLRLCFNNYSSEKKSTFLKASYQILDTGLGEKSCASDIDHIEVDLLPHNPEKQGLIELKELTDYIRWYKSQNRGYLL